MKTILCVLFLGMPTAALAQDHTGPATWYDQTGSEGGGCGVPPSLIESPDYVALNVQATPGDHSSMPARPLKDHVGEFANGMNCGRWVRVTAPGGASLDMVVTDSCQDTNDWCRDYPGHVDLRKSALTHFVQDGQTVNLLGNWNNPDVTWHYEKAPNYKGDVKFTLKEGSNAYWAALIITNLPNGIHGVWQLVDGHWTKASMQSDNGQVYVLPSAKRPFTIRVLDADDELMNDAKPFTI